LTLSIIAEHCYAECHYAECQGAKPLLLSGNLRQNKQNKSWVPFPAQGKKVYAVCSDHFLKTFRNSSKVSLFFIESMAVIIAVWGLVVEQDL